MTRQPKSINKVATFWIIYLCKRTKILRFFELNSSHFHLRSLSLYLNHVWPSNFHNSCFSYLLMFAIFRKRYISGSSSLACIFIFIIFNIWYIPLEKSLYLFKFVYTRHIWLILLEKYLYFRIIFIFLKFVYTFSNICLYEK